MAHQVVKERVRGPICVTAHPEGCRRNVEAQRDVIRAAPSAPVAGPKNILVIGSSTGYGLATRIAAAWGFGAKTVGVFLERAPEGRRTATAGYYNTAAFNQLAAEDGLYAGWVNGDAFSDEVKRQAAALVRSNLGTLDLVVYSLASPRRHDPRSGETFQTALKPIGDPYTGKTLDLSTGKVSEVTVEPADEDEVSATTAVMGGEDWQWWIEGLLEENLLAAGARTVAYSYVGPELTWPIYRHGTIGVAKKDLEQTSRRLSEILESKVGGGAWVSVNKAVVTQASAAIPVVPLYISLLFRVMKDKGIHEGCIEQMRRLTFDHLAAESGITVDAEGLIRLDNLELREDVQAEVVRLWEEVSTENLDELSDAAGFRGDFSRLFGFSVEGVDYEQPVETDVRL